MPVHIGELSTEVVTDTPAQGGGSERAEASGSNDRQWEKLAAYRAQQARCRLENDRTRAEGFND